MLNEEVVEVAEDMDPLEVEAAEPTLTDNGILPEDGEQPTEEEAAAFLLEFENGLGDFLDEADEDEEFEMVEVEEDE